MYLRLFLVQESGCETLHFPACGPIFFCIVDISVTQYLSYQSDIVIFLVKNRAAAVPEKLAGSPRYPQTDGFHVLLYHAGERSQGY